MRVNANDMGRVSIGLTRAPRVTVTFNGIELDFVVAADDDEGWVERLRLDRNGQPYLGPDGNVATEKICHLKGKLKIHVR